MAKPRALDESGLRAVREHLLAGRSLAETAAALGVSYKTVNHAARALNLRAANRPRPVYNDQMRDEAVARYQAGESSGQISRSLGTSDAWVLAQVKRAGVTARPTGALAGMSRMIADRYEAGESTGDIAAALGVTDTAISQHLAAAGVGVRRAGWARRLYPLRDDAFGFAAGADDDNGRPVWEPSAAYWAGFLMADGTVADSGRITIALAGVDREHIQAWLTFLGCPKVGIRDEEVRTGDKIYARARAQVSSRQLSTDLARNGIIPRKSQADQPVSDGLARQPSFWRGMIDGDGTITLPKGKHGPCLILVGNRSLMNQYVEFVHPIIAGRRPSVLDLSSTDAIVQVRVEGVRARRAIDVLWEGVDEESAPALARKLPRVRQALVWRTRTERGEA